MKVLLDENLPHRLRPLLMPLHEVITVEYMGWKSVKNGALLVLAATNKFDALVTVDQGLEYQQDQSALPCSVFIIMSKSNTLDDLLPFVPSLVATMQSAAPRTLHRITITSGFE